MKNSGKARSQNMRENNTSGSARSRNRVGESEALTRIFYDLLKDTLNAEKQLVKALPKMAKAATSVELERTFNDHLAVTENQVKRLERVFESCALKVSSKKCEAMEGLVKESKEAISETDDNSMARDVALIVAAQKVEHYEIAAYGSLRSIAHVLGFHEAASMLQQTLDEEGEADKQLTDLSAAINIEASNEND